MPYTAYIVILGLTIVILISGILLYRRRQAIKRIDHLHRKAMSVQIPDFVDTDPLPNNNPPTRRRIFCSGHFEFIQKLNDTMH